MMAFNNDVDVDKLFGYIYYWMTGKQSSGFTILEVSYSVGITIGILVFFNHFWKEAVFCGSDADGGADASV